MSALGIDVTCSGSPYEIGLAQGERLREKIASAYSALSKIESFVLSKPKFLPFTLFRLLVERKIIGKLRQPMQKDYAEMNERLLGLSDGSGVELRSIYLLNALEPFLSSIENEITLPIGGCSTMAVPPCRSAVNETIVAKNFDYLPLVRPFYIVRKVQPQGGYSSLEFTVSSHASAVDGINERGLCIIYNYAFALDTSQPTGVLSMLISKALSSCSTVREAAQLITSAPRWGAGILMLADTTGEIASLEISSTRHFLRTWNNQSLPLFNTNQFTNPKMREIEVPKDSIFSEHAPLALRGQRVHESSEKRGARFVQLLKKAPQYLSAEELWQIMSDHAGNSTGNDNTICVHGNYWCTTACLQIFPKSRRMLVHYDYACQGQFTELAL